MLTINWDFCLQSRGEFAAAITQFQKILELDPRHVAAQNNLAWLLATCPEASLRDGKRAVGLARQAEELSGGKSPEILDTLAVAYAEAGDFDNAIAAAKRMLTMAAARNDTLLAEAVTNRLRLYEAHIPYHETP
jgi:tetratricopeptide (TPR) repeat protein